MLKKFINIKRALYLVSALFLFGTNNVYCDEELADIMDSINEVREEYNSLPASNNSEAAIIDEAVKEIDKAVAFADQSFSIGDIESTMKTLDYIDKTLGDVNQLAAEEVSNDMSSVDLESFNKEATEKIVEITNNLKAKNEEALTTLVQNMVEVSKKGFDPFTTTRNLKDLGVETLGFQEIAKAIKEGHTIDITEDKEEAYLLAIYGKNLGFSEEDIKRDVEAALTGGIDEKIHLTKKYMKNLGYSPEDIEFEVNVMKAIESKDINGEIYYTVQYMQNLGASSQEIQQEINRIRGVSNQSIDLNNIRSDMDKYISGEYDEATMRSLGYNFLVSKEYVKGSNVTKTLDSSTLIKEQIAELDKKAAIKKVELEESKKQLEAIKATTKPNPTSSGINEPGNTLNDLYEYNLKEIETERKVASLTSEINDIESTNKILSKQLLGPEEKKETIKLELSELDEKLELKNTELKEAKKELKVIKSTPLATPETGYDYLQKNYEHFLNETKTENKIRKLSSDINNIELTSVVVSKQLLSSKEKKETIKLELSDLDEKLELKTVELEQAKKELREIKNTPLATPEAGYNYLQKNYEHFLNETKTENKISQLSSEIDDIQLTNNILLKETLNIDEAKNINLEEVKKIKEVEEVKEILKDETLKETVQDTAKEIEHDLQAVADEIYDLAQQGIKTDLEAKAKELGYNSFAEGVEAYNKQNGTEYTPEQAKAELGQ